MELPFSYITHNLIHKVCISIVKLLLIIIKLMLYLNFFYSLMGFIDVTDKIDVCVDLYEITY